MVLINKVYTKGGDKGETSLVGGARVPKDHPRVEAYGTMDELNSIIGLVRCFNLKKPQSKARDQFEDILLSIQHRLFDLGSDLATPEDKKNPNSPVIQEAHVKWLEDVIDDMNRDLPPLESFTLPGGTEITAFLHQARTVCRRMERRLITLNTNETINPQVIAYINRLSDALFVFSRWVTANLGEEEFLWIPNRKDEGV